jgi:hypothetical protein
MDGLRSKFQAGVGAIRGVFSGLLLEFAQIQKLRYICAVHSLHTGLTARL